METIKQYIKYSIPSFHDSFIEIEVGRKFSKKFSGLSLLEVIVIKSNFPEVILTPARVHEYRVRSAAVYSLCATIHQH